MEKLDTTPRYLRIFFIRMSAAFAIVGTLFLLRHKSVYALFYSLSLLFMVGIAAPVLLKPLYLFWMKLAFVIEWLVTRLIMAGIFYLVLTPLGLIIKLSGKDLLDRKIERDKGSYWKKNTSGPFDLKTYEKQF
jgi:multisubunit Na+/H+ antiporter MnhG subunit